jgi:hypothetical protein
MCASSGPRPVWAHEGRRYRIPVAMGAGHRSGSVVSLQTRHKPLRRRSGLAHDPWASSTWFPSTRGLLQVWLQARARPAFRILLALRTLYGRCSAESGATFHGALLQPTAALPIEQCTPGLCFQLHVLWRARCSTRSTHDASIRMLSVHPPTQRVNVLLPTTAVTADSFGSCAANGRRFASNFTSHAFSRLPNGTLTACAFLHCHQ